MSVLRGPNRGGSPEAIRHHYDLSNAFYSLWLDESMTYSCALWEAEAPEAPLAVAQQRKLDFHLRAARATGAARALDIGCGWGALLRRMREDFGVAQAVGLTLSEAQAEHVRSLGLSGVEVRTESWTAHTPAATYDAIVSIGAFEHFAQPEQASDQKIEIYRAFFERCCRWLAGSGRLSLQTIAYGTLRPEAASRFIQTEIFPDSELPHLGEIVAACEGLFEIVLLRNDRLDYARTCEAWLARLRARRGEALTLVGEAAVERYERYLKMSSVGFRMGKIGLLRLVLEPIRSRWHRAS
ncbi:SAM-dependent methyltransferase [Gloeobacter violaceus]|uniref:Cyclopropane-fatty-acyl-phospholipid synthase n=1 Tax=Gloeobacter violaceus (strain ATCC 29082 / PCC 7421) TaxID=251221 RepID=Q7NJ96_GLOVI|nr:cyclopropane-fatty-acyl-phospholipid synthase [Gloeobacter violaceus PCC 7421]